MPDTWTTNPSMLREALEGLGARCGVEARVLKPRESEWTCYMDSSKWQGDIYIHPVEEFYQSSWYYSPLVILFIAGIFIGLVWGKYFWRPKKKRVLHSAAANPEMGS